MNSHADELAQLRMTLDAFSLALDADACFDLMHWHPDLFGTGNASADARSACLAIGRQYLDKALAALAGWEKPSQCWFLAYENDSGDDALYVHTANPNGSGFPYAFDGVRWRLPAPPWLAPHFPEPAFVHGQSVFDGATLHWVVPAQPPGTVNRALVREWHNDRATGA